MEASVVRQDGQNLQAIAVGPSFHTTPTRTAIKTITNLQPVDSSAAGVVASKSKQQVRARMDINLTESDNYTVSESPGFILTTAVKIQSF